MTIETNEQAKNSKARVDKIVDLIIDENNCNATTSLADSIMIIKCVHEKCGDIKPMMKKWVLESLEEIL